MSRTRRTFGLLLLLRTTPSPGRRQSSPPSPTRSSSRPLTAAAARWTSCPAELRGELRRLTAAAAAATPVRTVRGREEETATGRKCQPYPPMYASHFVPPSLSLDGCRKQIIELAASPTFQLSSLLHGGAARPVSVNGTALSGDWMWRHHKSITNNVVISIARYLSIAGWHFRHKVLVRIWKGNC